VIPPSAVAIITVHRHHSLIISQRLRVLVLLLFLKCVAGVTRPLASLSKTASGDARQNIRSEWEWEWHVFFLLIFSVRPLAGTRFLFHFLSIAAVSSNQRKYQMSIKAEANYPFAHPILSLPCLSFLS
jgi:hypothetical protein